MPTGTGKTQVFSQIIKTFIEAREPGRKVLVLVHRIELLEQACERLKDFGIVAGKITAGIKYNEVHQVQIATVQSLIRREKLPLNLGLIVVDEGHHTPASTYMELINRYCFEDTKLLGVTATPHRLDGHGFAHIFDHMVESMSIPEFIEEGHLCDVEHLASSIPNLSKIQINKYTYDYEDKALKAVMIASNLVADVIQAFRDHCVRPDGSIRKTIIFCVDRIHALEVVSKYIENGFDIEFINWETTKSDRERTLDRFKTGDLNILCNVNIFTEGFDCPDIEVAQIIRPTKSLSLYLQMAGRCLRPKENGSKATILDHSNFWLDHQPIKTTRYWTLEGTKLFRRNGYFLTSNGNQVERDRPQEAKGLVIDRFQKYFTEDEIYNPDIKLEDVQNLRPFWKKLLSKNFNSLLIEDESLRVNLVHTRALNLSNTKIKTLLPLRFIKHIKSLDLTNSKIVSTKSLEEFRLLKTLQLKGTKINKLTYVSTLRSLVYLDLSENELTSLLPLTYLTNLLSLDLRNTQIKEWKSLGSLKNIEKLDLDGSNFNDLLTIISLHNLRRLDMSKVSVKNFNLIKQLQSLRELVLYSVRIDDFTILRYLRNLEKLDLSYTNVNDLSFIDDLPNLKELNISGIKFNSINLTPKRNLNLKEIYIYHPSMLEKKLEKHIYSISRQMPWCRFHYGANKIMYQYMEQLVDN